MVEADVEEEVRCVKRAPMGICGFGYYSHRCLVSSFPQYPFPQYHYCLTKGIIIQSPALSNDQINYSTDPHFHTPLCYLTFPCYPLFNNQIDYRSSLSYPSSLPHISLSSIVSTSLLSSSIVSLSLSPSSITKVAQNLLSLILELLSVFW